MPGGFCPGKSVRLAKQQGQQWRHQPCSLPPAPCIFWEGLATIYLLKYEESSPREDLHPLVSQQNHHCVFHQRQPKVCWLPEQSS